MSPPSPEPLPLFPPADFVERVNIGRANNWQGEGYPSPLLATDPLMMLLWHTATEGLRQPQPLFVITGV